MDKRRSPRYALSLNALVHPNEGRSWLCTIQDFCEGGMLLVEQGASRSRRSMPGISAGETVGIHFSVPTSDREKHFRLEGKIIRVMDSGVGINFPNGMDDDVMTALLNFSNSKPLRSKPPVPPASQSPGSSGRDAAQAGGSTTTTTSGTRQQSTAGSSSPRGGAAASVTTRQPNSGDSRRGGAPVAQGISANQPLLRGPIKPADKKRILAAVRKEVTRVLPEMNAAFFSYMDEELLKLARDAKTNAEQSEYFAAMSNLEKAKKNVGQAFANDVLDQMDNPRDLNTLLEERRAAEEERKKQQASRVKLSLINTEEFEDWLAVANIISRSERAYDRYLTEIRTRLGMLVDSWAHQEANPLGTAVFCHAFDNAIRSVDLSKEIRQKVYSGFEAKAIPLFRKLYIAVTKLMEDSKLFPDLDEDYISPSAITSRAAPTRESAKAEPEEVSKEASSSSDQPEDGDDEDDDDDFDIRQELKELRSQLKERVGGAGSGGSIKGARSRSRKRASTPKTIGQAISNIYSSLRSLGTTEDETEEDTVFESDELVELEEVQSLLNSLQPAPGLSIRQQLQDVAGRRLAPQVAESLDVVDNLMNTLETDSMLSPTVKQWVRDLELTLDKVAAQDTDFLNEASPHRSLEVINQLAQLGGSDSGSVRRDVDKIIQRINQNFDADPEIFDSALNELKPLVERQSRAFTGNVQRTVKASEGQQTLINAQRAVVEEMDERLRGREVPEVLMRLLMPGWRNLLVNTHLRQGQDSADWRRHVSALDQLVDHFEGKVQPGQEGYLPPEELLEQIETGLDSISFEPGRRVPLVNSLRRVLIEGQPASDLPKITVPADSIAETLGFGDVTLRDQLREELQAKYAADSHWQKWLDRAMSLHVGDWLEFQMQQAEPQVAILAWSNEGNTSYVFVNRRGVKTHDLLVEELATLLADGGAKVMEESDLPVTDRASHRMLQNMHNQLTHQATHDELTGLVNRKEFERLLDILLGETKRNKETHVVAFIDLDQFKVINNTAGHAAGDQLLANIAGLLKDQLGSARTEISRIAGNQFGVVIYNCEKDSGVSVIRQLADAIKANRFKWETETFSLTASCGVVIVNEDMESVSAILSGADSACYAAKEAGRDRIHVYEPGDSDMAHRRDIMAFVSQIDQALKEDRFVLNCQKIAPVDEGADEHAHYEILLTVLDENNKPMPPQDFIVAAETYNRMGAIDRWVIKNSFRWIAQNILKLDDLGAFSINISGNSLTEDDFMEFVLEQFNETRLPTSKICFEITETSAIGSLDDAIEFMERMKVIGVQFSLDDFGTGLSSYSYLRNLPVDYLKIDGIFVKDIKTNPSDYAVVKSINEIGHFMGKKTIAEYVEDDEILEILREIGVDFAQGYGIEMKMPLTELLD